MPRISTEEFNCRHSRADVQRPTSPHRTGNIVGAAYLPDANISVAAAYSGILVKYH